MHRRPDRLLPHHWATGKRRSPRPSVQAASWSYLASLLAGLIGLGLAYWVYLQGAVFVTAHLDDRIAVARSFGLAFALASGLTITILALALYLRSRRLARAEQTELSDLSAASETLRVLLGTLSEGVILTDHAGLIRLFNPAAEILFGRLGEEILQMPVSRLIPGLQARLEGDEGPNRSATAPQVRVLTGLRAGGEEFPVRLLTRDLLLDDESYRLILAEDLSESERNQRQMEFLEQHDPLTKLHNRQTFEQTLNEVAARPAQAQSPHAICLIDVDRFKLINDTCGHAAGNKLLEQLGRIIATKLSSATILARLGGDEFVALFVGGDAIAAPRACEDIVRTIRGFLFTWRERSFDITVSIGLVIFEPAHEDALAALGQADIACRLAKEQGRDRVHVYGHSDAGSIRHRIDLALIPTIGSALDQGRFHILAQPILALQQSDQPLHFEILVRMQDERGEPLAPDHFIPAAERHILMPAVDRWIIGHVFRHQAEQLRAWHERYPDRFMFAINLSATTVMDDGFLAYLKRQFKEFDIPYASICFEITETAAIVDLRRARDFMLDLQRLGSSFAVDDFGAGFASYSYLKSLPARYLKIDGSFVRNLQADPVDHALVESINHIGHILGLQTIAEWAETPELIAHLREIGVDYAQGYGVGEPVKLESLRLHRLLDPVSDLVK